MTTKHEAEETIESILSEEEVKKQFGFSREILAHLRKYERLPFLRVNRVRLYYLEEDLVKWFKSRRVILEPSFKTKRERAEWELQRDAYNEKQTQRQRKKG